MKPMVTPSRLTLWSSTGKPGSLSSGDLLASPGTTSRTDLRSRYRSQLSWLERGPLPYPLPNRDLQEPVGCLTSAPLGPMGVLPWSLSAFLSGFGSTFPPFGNSSLSMVPRGPKIFSKPTWRLYPNLMRDLSLPLIKDPSRSCQRTIAFSVRVYSEL